MCVSYTIIFDQILTCRNYISSDVKRNNLQLVSVTNYRCKNYKCIIMRSRVSETTDHTLTIKIHCDSSHSMPMRVLTVSIKFIVCRPTWHLLLYSLLSAPFCPTGEKRASAISIFFLWQLLNNLTINLQKFSIKLFKIQWRVIYRLNPVHGPRITYFRFVSAYTTWLLSVPAFCQHHRQTECFRQHISTTKNAAISIR